MKLLFCVFIAALVLSGCSTDPTATAAPPACVKAIDAARKMHSIFLATLDDATVYVDQIRPAAKAGLEDDAAAMDRIARRIRGTNRRVTRETDRMDGAAKAFNTYAAECK